MDDIRLEVESALALAGGISSAELQARADKIIAICAECGITAAQLHALLADFEPPSLEAAARELQKAEKAARKASGPVAAKIMDGFGEAFQKSRRRWGWKRLRAQYPQIKELEIMASRENGQRRRAQAGASRKI